MSNIPISCGVCGCRDGKIHRVKEMMFGTGSEFQYLECRDCGCLSCQDAPSNLSRYYPDGYYSMAERRTSAIRKIRDYIYLSRLSFFVKWHSRSDLDVVRRTKLTCHHTFLDVGCGTGHLIGDLRELGYDAMGVDPYVSADVRDRFGVRVFKRNLEEIDGRYDLVLFRHSLEHMTRQVETLQSARQRLRPGGTCVVCIPVLGWAWREYGVCWSQLDAPRHLYLHTLKSFSSVVAQAGFRIDQVVYDSDEFQFWASELYSQGRHLQGSARPGLIQRMRMRRRARTLNAAQDGDKAQFYLTCT